MFRTPEAAFIFGYLERMATLAPVRLPLGSSEVPLDPPLRPDEWAALCDLIGCDTTARAAMVAPIDMRARPLLILRDGRALLYDISHALDQLWDAFERAAKGAEPRWSGLYAQYRGEWLEEELATCLRRVFPASSIYRHLSYPDPDKPGNTTELDVAVSWPPFLILVEAKASQFRLAGRLGDTRLLSNDLRANVAAAFEQARRARRYIETNEEAVFTEIATGRTLSIQRDALRQTYLTTVSLHTLADLTTRLSSIRSLGLFKDGEFPWALSIADLDIVTRHCPGPDVLLHYVERRLALQTGKPMIIGDELELFGAYLSTRLQPERIWERPGKPFDFVNISGYQEQFDAAMAQARGDRINAPSIRLAVPPEIDTLLATVRNYGSEDGRWIAFELLALPDESLGAIAHIIRKLREEPIPSGKFRSAALAVRDCTISITSTRDMPTEALFRKTFSEPSCKSIGARR